MLNTQQQRVVIKPTNSKPKGVLAIALWIMLILGIISFPVGGCVLVGFSSYFLFFHPHIVRKKFPVSLILDEHLLHIYTWHNKETCSIPWKDIEGIYTISMHWAYPKNIGLRLKDYNHLQNSCAQTDINSFWQFLNKFFSNKYMLRLGRMMTKCEVLLPYTLLDRPTQDFCKLLMQYL